MSGKKSNEKKIVNNLNTANNSKNCKNGSISQGSNNDKASEFQEVKSADVRTIQNATQASKKRRFVFSNCFYYHF